MAQKKLLRFNEIKTFRNVLEYPENMQGKWNKYFKNNHPIILEVACGKGEYTIGLAQLYPEKNFIGIDIKGNRLWVGAKISIEKNLLNTAFLRTQVDKINEYFSTNEVDEIWITFPDPHLRKSKARKRLTHPKFLRMYNRFLKPGGLIHLKTDSSDLYEFTKSVIELYHLKMVEDVNDLYKNHDLKDELKIKTHYEGLDISKSNTIFYLSFSLPEIINNDDEILNRFLNNNDESFTNKAFDDEEFYFNENGFTVFTEKYLLQRGYCCGNGCLNCPYDYKNVPEPKRSKLLALKQDEEFKK